MLAHAQHGGHGGRGGHSGGYGYQDYWYGFIHKHTTTTHSPYVYFKRHTIPYEDLYESTFTDHYVFHTPSPKKKYYYSMPSYGHRGGGYPSDAKLSGKSGSAGLNTLGATTLQAMFAGASRKSLANVLPYYNPYTGQLTSTNWNPLTGLNYGQQGSINSLYGGSSNYGSVNPLASLLPLQARTKKISRKYKRPKSLAETYLGDLNTAGVTQGLPGLSQVNYPSYAHTGMHGQLGRSYANVLPYLNYIQQQQQRQSNFGSYLNGRTSLGYPTQSLFPQQRAYPYSYGLQSLNNQRGLASTTPYLGLQPQQALLGNRMTSVQSGLENIPGLSGLNAYQLSVLSSLLTQNSGSPSSLLGNQVSSPAVPQNADFGSLMKQLGATLKQRKDNKPSNEEFNRRAKYIPKIAGKLLHKTFLLPW